MVVMTKNDIDWQIIKLRRMQWEDNTDPMLESAPSFAVWDKCMEMLSFLHSFLLEWCPQDISTFKISDKSYGEVSFQWYGKVFELDLDVSTNGEISFLLCETGKPKRQQVSVENSTLEQLGEALIGVKHASV